MQHTDSNKLRNIALLLQAQPFGNRARVVKELSLLTAWAHWSYQRFKSVSFNEQQPDLSYAYQEMSKRYSAGHVFHQSCLYEVCPAPLINQIVDLLKMQDWSDGSQSVECLLSVVRELGSDEESGLLPDALGQLMALLAQPTLENKKTSKGALYHGMSLAALPHLVNTGSVVVYVQQANPLYVAVCALLDVTLELSGSMFDRAFTKSDFVISAPPLNQSIDHEVYRHSQDAAVSRAAHEVVDRGVVLVPPGFLFQRSSSPIRESLVENNLLDAVISLPKGQLGFTAVAPVLLVLNKHRAESDPIQFYHCDQGTSQNHYQKLSAAVHGREPSSHGVLSSLEQIRENSYDLTVNRYCIGDATAAVGAIENTVALEGVADIIRAQSLKSEEAQLEDTDAYLEVAVKDIDESGNLSTPDKCIKVDPKQQRRVNSQRLKPGDILLAIKGSVGRTALVGESCGANWVAGQAFVIIRPKKTISTIYLYRYLSSELVQAYLSERSTGTAMKMLKASDVTDIPVPLLDATSQEEIERNYQAIQAEYAAIHEHYDTIRRLQSSHWTLNTEQGVA